MKLTTEQFKQLLPYCNTEKQLIRLKKVMNLMVIKQKPVRTGVENRSSLSISQIRKHARDQGFQVGGEKFANHAYC